MEQLKNNTYDSTIQYLNTLRYLGYVPENEVKKLILLTAIEEIYNGTMKEYMEEEDIKACNKVVNCIYNSSCIFQ